MTVRAILSLKGGDVTTIKPTDSLVTAAKVLAERRIGALVVTDTAEHVAGILSERDIVRALAELESAAQRSRCINQDFGAFPVRKSGAQVCKHVRSWRYTLPASQFELLVSK